MPIPVSVTGWANKGDAQAAELETAGPFARLGGAAAVQPAAQPAAHEAPKGAASSTDAVCKVTGLTFHHAGLGALPEATQRFVSHALRGAYAHAALRRSGRRVLCRASPPISGRSSGPVFAAAYRALCHADGRPQPGSCAVLEDISFSLPRGSRVLLLGSNGAGKSTLLRILAGKHMVQEGCVQVLGRDVFHDTDLTCDGELAFIGGQWQKDAVAFAGYAVPLQGDFPASRMLDAVTCDPARRARIIRALDVDVNWRMNKVSDGQRRRVQLAWGLMRPFTFLLLDEVTVDLDVLARAELMSFLVAECEERGASIVYATHIFDGLERWATHLALLAGGKMQLSPTRELPQLAKYNGRLFPFMHAWLREEQERAAAVQVVKVQPVMLSNNGWGAGRSAPTVAA